MSLGHIKPGPDKPDAPPNNDNPPRLSVVGDLKDPRPLRERDVYPLDRDDVGLEKLLKSTQSTLTLRVENTLSPGEEVVFTFKPESMKDFHPDQLASEIPNLDTHRTLRDQLADISVQANRSDAYQHRVMAMVARANEARAKRSEQAFPLAADPEGDDTHAD